MDDFVAICKNLGEKITKNEIQELISEADKDGDQTMDYKEFIKLIYFK